MKGCDDVFWLYDVEDQYFVVDMFEFNFDSFCEIWCLQNVFDLVDGFFDSNGMCSCLSFFVFVWIGIIDIDVFDLLYIVCYGMVGDVGFVDRVRFIYVRIFVIVVVLEVELGVFICLSLVVDYV